MRPAGVVRLDAGEYAAAWRPLGDKPTVLYARDHGETFGARDALDAAAWERLATRGLAVGRAPEPVLADVLAVLAAPDTEVEGRWWSGDADRGVLAAARGGHGVVAELDGAGGLRAEPVEGRAIVAALLARVPAGEPLPGVPITVPAAAIGAPDPRERERLLRRASVPRPTMQRLTALWSSPPRRLLAFDVARRGADGRRRRGPSTLEVVDADVGRLAVVREPTGRYLTLRPAGAAWLRSELTALLDAC